MIRKSRFYSWIVIVLCLLFISSKPSNADERLREQIRNLQSHLDTLTRLYPSYIRLVHSSEINGHFLQTLEDYQAIYQFVSEDVIASSRRASLVRTKLDEIKHRIRPESPTFREDVSDLLSFRLFSENERAILKTGLADLQDLREGWRNRCSDETIGRLAVRYNPSTLYRLDSIPAPVPQEGPTIGLSVTADRNGNPTSASYLGTGGITSRYGISSSVGSALGSTQTVHQFLGVKAAIGGLIGFGVGIIIIGVYDLITGNSTLDFSYEVNQIWDLVHQIRELQKRTLEQEEMRNNLFIQQACRETLRHELEGLLDVKIGATQEQLHKVEQMILDLEQTQEDISRSYEAHVEQIERMHPIILETYLEKIDTEARKSILMNRDSMQFIRDELTHPLMDYRRVPQHDSIFRLDLKHQIWSKAIRGDAKYHRSNLFSFSSRTPLDKLEIVTYWDSFFQKIKLILAP